MMSTSAAATPESTASSLRSYYERITDPRRAQGRRFALADVLTMVTMGIMSGCYSLRALRTFMHANAAELREALCLKREEMPSHVTIREVLRRIETDELQRAFVDWAAENHEIEAGELISIDGKSLASTISDIHDVNQNFIAVVSAFAQRQGTVVSLRSYANKKSSEIPVVRDLIAALRLEGATLSLDALHCQKKQSARSSAAATTT